MSSGAITGQFVLAAATPLITRLFDPDQLGVYAVLAAIIGMFATVVGLHYELAVPLPASQARAVHVARLSLMAAGVMSVVVGTGLLAFGSNVLVLSNASELSNLLWVVPICLLLTGLINTLTTWAIRVRAFSGTAASKALQGLGQAGAQISGGVVHAGVSGLVAGQFGGLIFGVAPLLRAARPVFALKKYAWSTAWLIAVARKYRRFPLITTWSSLVNALGANLPVVMFSSLFGGYVAGQFALSFRLLQMPLRLVGQSVSQVFFSHAASAVRDRSLPSLAEGVYRGMVAFGLPSFVIGAAIAPQFFEVIFGRDWVDGGRYTQVLMPWMFFSFISNAFSVLVSVLGRQGSELGFQVLIVVVVSVSLLLGAWYQSAMIAASILGGLGGAALFAKVVWLLGIAGVPAKVHLRVLTTEGAIAIVLGAVVWWASSVLKDPIVVTVTGVAALLLVHGVNLWGRDVYVMRSRSPSRL